MLIPLVGVVSYPYSLVFVWRQLELAFFGAVTSVAALFDLRRKKRRIKMEEQNNQNFETQTTEVIEGKKTVQKNNTTGIIVGAVLAFIAIIAVVLIIALVGRSDSGEQHKHTWEDATCITAKTCTECGIETGNVSATNHNYGEWQTVTAVSCTENGTKKQTCAWCNNEKTETITAMGHNYVDGVCNKCNTNEALTFRDIKYYDKGNYYEWWLGVENSSGELVKATATVTYEQYNDSELVYKNTFTVTPNDFSEMTRSNGDIELRGLIIVNKADMKAGVSDRGTCVFNVEINEKKFIDNDGWIDGLPQIKTTLNTPTLPKTIYNKTSSGTTKQMLKVTDITYKTNGDDLFIYISGEKTFDKEGNNYSRYSTIGYKVLDSEGFVVGSGTLYVTSLSVGDKFKNEIIYVANITLGETYTLELIDTV